MQRTKLAAVVVLAAAGFALHAAQPQPSGIRRTALLQTDLSSTGKEVIQVRVDFAAGAEFPAHSHPGEEIAYVIEGSLEYRLEGQAPITLTAGQTLFIPAGTAHTAKNAGSGNAAELATYIVPKGKPLVVVSQ